MSETKADFVVPVVNVITGNNGSCDLIVVASFTEQNEGSDRNGKSERIICNFWGLLNLHKLAMLSLGLTVAVGAI